LVHTYYSSFIPEGATDSDIPQRHPHFTKITSYENYCRGSNSENRSPQTI
jgi:hypothetical protein